MNFKNWLTSTITLMNLSQKQLADKVGKSESAVSLWIKGERTPSIETIESVVKKLWEDDICMQRMSFLEIYASKLPKGKILREVFYIEPKAAPRPRHAGRRTYMPKDYMDWKSSFRAKLASIKTKWLKIELCKEEWSGMNENHFTMFIPIGIDSNLDKIEIDCIFRRPKKYYAKKYPPGLFLKRTRPDWDNCAKGVQDVLQDAHIISDDGIIPIGTTRKWYSEKNKPPRIIITLYTS